MIFLLYTGTSALIIFLTSSEQRNIVQLCTTSSLTEEGGLREGSVKRGALCQRRSSNLQLQMNRANCKSRWGWGYWRLLPRKRKWHEKLYSMKKPKIWITHSAFKAWIPRQKLVLGIHCIQHSDCPSLMAKTRKVQIDFLIASFLFKFSLTYFVVERASEIVGD